MLTDTHAHLYCEEFDADRTETVNRAKEAGIGRIILPNIDSSTTESMLKMCEQYPGYCFPAIGVHPTSVTSENLQDELQAVQRQLETNAGRFVAIGEIGLDLYWDKTYLNEQLEALRKQFDWAIETGLPVIIHCREAWTELLACMEPYRERGLRGVFHSFTGDHQTAREILRFDRFMVGINGVVTFKNSTLADVLKLIPPERVVLETDSPYLAPVPNRGKRNESSNLTHILKKVAEAYQTDEAEIARITTNNADRLFEEPKYHKEDFKLY